MSTKKSILLLLGISILVYFKWLLPGIFTNGDWWYASSTYLHSLLSLPYIWSSISSFGGVDLLAWRYPINFLYGILSIFHFDSGISDRILVFWPTIILGNLSIFFLAKKIIKSNAASLIAAIAFNFNTYFFVAQTAFLLYAGAVWSVITLSLFMLALEKRKLYLVLTSGVCLFISGAYDLRMAYIGVFLLMGYFLYHNLFVLRSKNELINSFVSFVTVFVAFGLFNLYWVSPLIFSEKFVSNVILQRGLFGNEFLNILYAITLYHPFWTGKQIAVFDPQSIMIYFWIIPVVSFLGLFLGRKNKNILFFGIIAFVGIFLTKQVGQPFSYVYLFLFQHLPGFSAFREASKFYFLVALGFSILLGAFIAYINKRFIIKKIYLYLITVCLIAVFVSNGIPFIQGDLGMSVPTAKPNDYQLLDSFIMQQNGFLRSLWIPAFSRWGSGDLLHTILPGMEVINSQWANLFLKGNNSYIDDGGTLLMNSMNKPFAQNLLSNSSIKYVILPLEDKKNNDNFFVFYGQSKDFYIRKLDKITYLKKININTKHIDVYENKNYRPHIYTTSEKETIYKTIPYHPTVFEYVNPTKYTVQLKSISKPIYLNFSDTYNPNWKLRLGSFNWWGAIAKHNYFLSLPHFANDAGLNSFYIDPGRVCAQGAGCVKNKNGSYSMDLTLYFKPQSYVYLGGIISSVTLLGTVFLIVVLGIKEVKLWKKK